METHKTGINIKLTTEIKELGQKAVMVVEEEGSLFQKGPTTVLTFTEHQEEQEDVHALVTIQAEKVSIKRTGAVSMHQVFKKKQTTENVYRHAYGTMQMETHTDQIIYEAPERKGGKGRLFISYTTKLNGEGNRRHRLHLYFAEK